MDNKILEMIQGQIGYRFKNTDLLFSIIHLLALNIYHFQNNFLSLSLK